MTRSAGERKSRITPKIDRLQKSLPAVDTIGFSRLLG
jgi:hypothetical protein